MTMQATPDKALMSHDWPICGDACERRSWKARTRRPTGRRAYMERCCRVHVRSDPSSLPCLLLSVACFQTCCAASDVNANFDGLLLRSVAVPMCDGSGLGQFGVLQRAA